MIDQGEDITPWQAVKVDHDDRVQALATQPDADALTHMLAPMLA